jgi:hypothetical protein
MRAALTISAGLVLVLAHQATGLCGALVGRVRLVGNIPYQEYRRVVHRFSDATQSRALLAQRPGCERLAGGLGISGRGEVRNAIVYVQSLQSTRVPVRRSRRPHVVAVRTIRFEPRILAIQSGERVAFLSRAREAVRIQSSSKALTLSFALEKRGKRKIVKFHQPGFVSIGSSGRPWMEMHVRVHNHPFFTMTSERGIFRIEDIPEGRRRVSIWHGVLGSHTQEVHVPPQGLARVRFRVLIPGGLSERIRECADL